MSPLARAVWQQLVTAETINGQHLADHLQVTRAAIWKAVTELRQLGLTIESAHRLGYQLIHPNLPLDPLRIAQIGELSSSNCQLDILDQIDSTNDFLLQRSPSPQWEAVLAEQQQAGRGRRGNLWHSPFAANIYGSLKVRFKEHTAASLSGLSLAVGFVLADVLKEFITQASAHLPATTQANLLKQCAQIKVKWPNDIIMNKHKLAGILIDITGESAGPVTVVIGVGINVRMPDNTVIDQAWTDLYQLLDRQVIPDRNQLAGALLKQLLALCHHVDMHGVPPLSQRWPVYSAYYEQAVCLIQGSQQFHGVEQGITDNGAYLLKTETQIKTIVAGELSLRAASTH